LFNCWQRISHAFGGEKHYRSELFCDELGKGTHRMTKVLHKATYKVFDVVHDMMDKKKETDHEVKEEVKDLYSKKKETSHMTRGQIIKSF